MRYYRIELSKASDDSPITLPSLKGSGMPPGVITSLLPDGTTNPAALHIEMDLCVYGGDVGSVSSYLRIWGLSLTELSRGFDLNQQKIKIFGGMAKGLPLANPRQQGLLVQGTILQAFGNWIGTDQTLDMFLGPSNAGSPEKPVNYAFTWNKSETLAVAIKRTLATATPDTKVSISISDQRVGNQSPSKDGFYESFTQFAAHIKEITVGALNNNDQGVTMTDNGQVINVFEAKAGEAGTGKKIEFRDLLGQPTWIEPLTMQAKMVMRGDLHVGDTITLPKGLLVTTTGNAMPAFGGTGSQNPSNGLAFNGDLLINQIQHWGAFRQPDAMAWNTTVNGIIGPKQQ